MKSLIYGLLMVLTTAASAQDTSDLYLVKAHKGRSAIYSVSSSVIRTELTDSIRWASMRDSTAVLVRRENSYEYWKKDFNHCLVSGATDYKTDWYYRILLFQKNAFWQYYNFDGSIRYNRVFEDASTFVDGYAYVKINGKYGFIDTAGNDVAQVPKDVREHFEKWGAEEYVAVADVPRFRAAGFTLFNNGLFSGIKNASTGEIVLEAVYESIYKPKNNLVIVRKNGNYGLYNYKKQAFVLDCIYKQISLIND